MRDFRSLRLVALALLLPALAFGAPSSQMNLAAIAQTEVVNVRAYGAVCDGATDDFAAFTSATTAAGSGGKVYIPPSATACMFAQPWTITGPLTVLATPGTVTLKARTGNTGNPVILFSVNGATGPVLVYGVTFDGGGSAFANTNNVVQVFNSTNVTFDHDIFQNTRGIGLLVSSSSITGVRDSQFINIGMDWVNTLVNTDRYQGVAFCCTNTMTPAKNFANHNYFHNIGLDSISMTNQLDYQIIGNRFDLALGTPQWVTLPSATAWAACVYVNANTAGIIEGNVCDSASGNAYDIGTTGGHSNLVLSGNFATTTGGAGITLTASNQFVITGNTLINGDQNSANCALGGLTFAGTDTVGTVVGNTITDTQGTKTQVYGMYGINACTLTSTLTNVTIDPNNQLLGNKTAAFGGSLSQSLLGTQTVSEALTINGIASSTILTLIPNAAFGILIGQSGNTDAIAVTNSAGNPAAFILRGNALAGASGFEISQDGSGNAVLNQKNAGPLNLATSGTTRLSIASGGNAIFSGALVSGGATFGFTSGTGTCATTSTLQGGLQSGNLTCTTAGTAASTITLALAATTAGYTCWGRDITTPTTVTQTGPKSTTAVTLTLTSVTANDVIQFGCLGY